VTPTNVQYLRETLKTRSGLVLTDDKNYLLESRLGPVARKHGFESLDLFIDDIRAKRDNARLREITEAMTINESYFFRDNTPFDTFRKHTLPALVQARGNTRQLRIWSAASSTGQEPYSLAMILKEEAAKLTGWRIDILGTDLSPTVLEKAKVGLYSQFEVQRGLPIQMLVKYFQQVNEMWQIDSSIRAMVRFREANLLENIRSLGNFDVVFCRNVLIYFDQATKGKILGEIAQMMPEDGVLFLGGAETVIGVTDRFKPIPGQRGVYGRTDAK
jgi:chemotaxis protein methyltransferase CheR